MRSPPGMTSIVGPLVLAVAVVGCGSDGLPAPADAGRSPRDARFALPLPDAASCVVDEDCREPASGAQPCGAPRCVDGSCARVAEPDGTACDDGSACTSDDQCVRGECRGDVMECADDDPCTDDSCADGECLYVPGTSLCDDGEPCTVGDVCAGGVCVGRERACDDDDQCTTDACVPGSGCSHERRSGDCDDSDACTTGERCTHQGCAGESVECDDGNPCTADACLPESGCEHAVTTGGCDDGDPCTVDDSCRHAVCVPGPWDRLLDGCATPLCGDRMCAEGEEDCRSCAVDCGTCCGDGACVETDGEACTTCVVDCGPCPGCGDGTCDAGADEDCDTCEGDCGACPDACSPSDLLRCGEPVFGDLVGAGITDALRSYPCGAAADIDHPGAERAYVLGATCDGVVTVELERTSGQGGLLDVLVLDARRPCRGDACLFSGAMEASSLGAKAAVSFATKIGDAFHVVVDGAHGAVSDYRLTAECACAFPDELCDGGVDEDLDGRTDCDDPQCVHAAACGGVETTCDDGLDDDVDGGTDCGDEDCGCTPPEEVCEGDIDEDLDGRTDCFDDDCAETDTCRPPSEVCGHDIELAAEGLDQARTNAGFDDTVSLHSGICVGLPDGAGLGAADVVVRLVPEVAGTWQVVVTPQDATVGLGVYALTGCGTAEQECIASGSTEGGVAVGFRLELTPEAETLLFIDGLSAGDEGLFRLQVFPAEL